jgi:hypothetical protein
VEEICGPQISHAMPAGRKCQWALDEGTALGIEEGKVTESGQFECAAEESR